MHWGHARSRDLVHWEHLPIALAPSYNMGEGHCFSGCAAVNGLGQPMLFYTSVPPRPAEGQPPARPFEQWAAISDDWITWRRHPDNPILPQQPGFLGEWRDPFLFRHEGRTFMVVGMCGVGLPLYEALDDTLARWTYRGLISDVNAEVPNFLPLQDKWVFLCSPFDAVPYQVGDFDLQALTFTPQAQGILDPGRTDGNGFYAQNILFDDRGRCVLFGWINGCGGPGWRGIISLPRELTIGTDGHPRQEPVAELRKLRGSEKRLQLTGDNRLIDRTVALPTPGGNSLEIVLRFGRGPTAACGLRLRWPGKMSVIRFDGERFHVAGADGRFALRPDEALRLQVFLDRSVVEVFVNEGRTCISRCLQAGTEPVTLEAFVEGEAELEGSIYEMKPVW